MTQSGDLHVLSASADDELSSFRCRTLNTLTAAARLSAAAHIVISGDYSLLERCLIIVKGRLNRDSFPTFLLLFSDAQAHKRRYSFASLWRLSESSSLNSPLDYFSEYICIYNLYIIYIYVMYY